MAAGKPAPDVYLAATRRLGVNPADAAAVEDSTNGLRAAAQATTNNREDTFACLRGPGT